MDEVARKLVHLLFGIAIAVLIFVLERDVMIVLLAIALLAGFILSDAIRRSYTVPLITPIIARLERRHVLPGAGALYFTFSALSCLIIFPVRLVVPAIFSLAVLDGVATLAGMRFGKRKIWGEKTLEGTAAGIAATFLVLLLLLPPDLALAAAVTAGVIELLSPVDDNLVVPVGVCILLLVIM
jgi:phytol kinase